MIHVVTVIAARGGAWEPYLPLLFWQRASALRWGHRHTVVSEIDIPGMSVHRAELPDNLMHAILAGQIAWLEAWDGADPVVLVDADVLIARDLTDAFQSFDRRHPWTDKWGLKVTSRPGAECEVNNGAIYVNAGAREEALGFFRHALSICGLHWGADQEAIAAAASPIPREHGGVKTRAGALVHYAPMLSHNCIPEMEGELHKRHPFVVHFKGEKRKPWMRTYLERFILDKAAA